MTLRERLGATVLVLDGAMGTQLMAHGARGSNEQWGVDHRDDLVAIHRAYVDAGAGAILTNTFGGSRLKLQRAGLGDRTVQLNRALAGMAREAASGKAFVLGDVGPTGQFVEPYGDVSEEEMTDVFREQIGALLEGGVDGIMIETMMDPTEAACAVRAARLLAPDRVVLAALAFDRSPRGFRTLMGTTPSDGAQRLLDAGADAVGANCGGMTPEDFVPLLEEMHRAVSVPLVVEANAGLPQIEDGKTVFKEGPDTFGRLARAYVNAGARIIGGCCGTTPDHIRAIAEAIKAS